MPFRAGLRSIVPVDRFQLVCYGAQTDRGTPYLVRDLRLSGSRDAADVSGTVELTASGWCLVRASSDGAKYPVLDNYIYATTSPIYVTIAGRKPRSPQDAAYFVHWMDRVIGMASRYPDWNSPAEKEIVLKRLQEAKAVYQNLP